MRNPIWFRVLADGVALAGRLAASFATSASVTARPRLAHFCEVIWETSSFFRVGAFFEGRTSSYVSASILRKASPVLTLSNFLTKSIASKLLPHSEKQV